MPASAPPIFELKAELFKALAHPVRVRTLELLVEGDQPVQRLLAELDIEASHLSQHLAVLKRAGVVTSERVGNAVTYHLAEASVAQLLAAARTFLVGRVARTGDALAGSQR